MAIKNTSAKRRAQERRRDPWAAVQASITAAVEAYQERVAQLTPEEQIADMAAALRRGYQSLERRFSGHDAATTGVRRGRGKSRRSLDLIEQLRAILQQIQPASVRAVAYQAFTRGLIPDLSKRSTNRLSALLTYAREARLVAWQTIVDETRGPERVDAWENPAPYIETVKTSYRRDRWSLQPLRVQIVSEKATVLGTLRPVADRYGVTIRTMHGYGSATAVFDLARDSAGCDKPLIVFYVGDWDPSGLHMSEVDLPRRLRQYGGKLTLLRLALTEEDTHTGLPSFGTDTKKRDARYRWYADRFGPRCWELDALSPVVLRDRVEQAIRERLDLGAWAQADAAECAELESLSSILQTWPGMAERSISGRRNTQTESTNEPTSRVARSRSDPRWPDRPRASAGAYGTAPPGNREPDPVVSSRGGTCL